MEKIICLVIGIPLSILLIGGFLNQLFGWFDFFFHDILHWNDGKGSTVGFDGCSLTATCSKCGKKVLQDSQGNWF